MNIKERKLLAYFLELATDEFGNHGCNDVNESVWEDWTLEERRKFVKEFHDYNGDPEYYIEGFHHIPDYAIMGFFAHKLIDIKDIRKEKLKELEPLNEYGLKPCPFCGEREYVEVVRVGTNRQSCQVQCSNCSGSLESNEIGSGDAWNDRV